MTPQEEIPGVKDNSDGVPHPRVLSVDILFCSDWFPSVSTDELNQLLHCRASGWQNFCGDQTWLCVCVCCGIRWSTHCTESLVVLCLFSRISLLGILMYWQFYLDNSSFVIQM